MCVYIHVGTYVGLWMCYIAWRRLDYNGILWKLCHWACKWRPLNPIVLTHTVIPQNSSYQFTSYPSLEIRKFVTGFQIQSQLLLKGKPSSRKETVLPAPIHDCYFPHLECELPSSIPNQSLQIRLVIYSWSFDILSQA